MKKKDKEKLASKYHTWEKRRETHKSINIASAITNCRKESYVSKPITRVTAPSTYETTDVGKAASRANGTAMVDGLVAPGIRHM